MLARIMNILKKEVIDSLRDKKALRQAILIPLIIGVFYSVFNPWINSIVIARAKEPLTIWLASLCSTSVERHFSCEKLLFSSSPTALFRPSILDRP